MDATGSMATYVKSTCKSLKYLINDINNIFGNESANLGAIFYRDYKDKP